MATQSFMKIDCASKDMIVRTNLVGDCLFLHQNAFIANEQVVYNLVADVNCIIQITPTVATQVFTLLSASNSIIGTVTGTIATTTIGNLVAGTNYYLQMRTVAAIAINTLVFALRSLTTPIVSDYFMNGFQTSEPFIQGITSTTDDFGSITYQFTNVQLTQGTQNGLFLGYSGICLKTANVTYTSSNTAVFANVSDTISPNIAIHIQLNPLITTTFTGTVVISVTGVGIQATSTTLATPNISSQLLSSTRMLRQNGVPPIESMMIMKAIDNEPLNKQKRQRVDVEESTDMNIL